VASIPSLQTLRMKLTLQRTGALCIGEKASLWASGRVQLTSRTVMNAGQGSEPWQGDPGRNAFDTVYQQVSSILVQSATRSSSPAEFN
jgi:hypothetical protein